MGGIEAAFVTADKLEVALSRDDLDRETFRFVDLLDRLENRLEFILAYSPPTSPEQPEQPARSAIHNHTLFFASLNDRLAGIIERIDL